ncbi:MAG: TetR/AcrR family transcriptional regulator [Beijerinckiaceae bacterium]|jgi:TetR/AcrR family transcriptional repressor of uid operon|nr:TetR/AcrR family transcriptional regulator [Beijerinckiaceae bacterium]
MDGARACFHRHGFHAAGTADIAAAAKVSVANLYQYFSSKDELIIAIAEEDLNADLALLGTIKSAGSIEKAMELAVEAITREASDPSVSRLRLEVSTEATRNPGVADVVLRAEHMQRAALEEWIRQSQAKGELAADLDPELSAFALLCLIDGAFARVATGVLQPGSAARDLMCAIRALFRI